MNLKPYIKCAIALVRYNWNSFPNNNSWMNRIYLISFKPLKHKLYQVVFKAYAKDMNQDTSVLQSGIPAKSPNYIK